MYAHEDYLDNPPTVEEVRFATQQYLRTRGSYREKAPFGQQNQNRQPPAPQMPQRQVVPQPNIIPQQGINNAPPQNPAPALPNERKPEPANPPAANPNAFNNRPCFACQQFGHFARGCPNRDNTKVYKPVNPTSESSESTGSSSALPEAFFVAGCPY